MRLYISKTSTNCTHGRTENNKHVSNISETRTLCIRIAHKILMILSPCNIVGKQKIKPRCDCETNTPVLFVYRTCSVLLSFESFCELFWNRKRLRIHPFVHYSICAVSCAQLHDWHANVHKCKCGNDCHPALMLAVCQTLLWLRFLRSVVWPSCFLCWNLFKVKPSILQTIGTGATCYASYPTGDTLHWCIFPLRLSHTSISLLSSSSGSGSCSLVAGL